MTEFELLSLIELYNAGLVDTITTYITILFGFIVAVHFVGQKMPKWVLISFGAVYTVMTLLTASAIVLSSNRLSSVREALLLLDQSTLSPVALGIINQSVNSTLYMVFFIVLILGSYIGSITFLAYELKANKVKGNSNS